MKKQTKVMGINRILAATNEMVTRLEKEFESRLPHGAGINYKWEVIVNLEKRTVTCYNKYDCMNEVGYYDGVASFYVVFDESKNEKDPDNLLLHFSDSKSQKLNKKYLLRNYLEDTFAVWYNENIDLFL